MYKRQAQQSVTLTAPSAVSTSYSMTLPTAAATASDSLVQSDTSGVLSYLSANTITPVGSILSYAGTVAPTGFFLCVGDTVSRTTYAALYAVTGDAYGNGDGTTTFHLPDLRARFLRGNDFGVGRDPDRDSRTAMNSGGNTGNNIGTVQDHALQAHTHTYPDQVNSGTVEVDGDTDFLQGADYPISGNVDVTRTTANHNANSSSETRPVNVYVNFIIKW